MEDQTFAVDFYLSTLKKVKDLVVFSYQEVLDNMEELYDFIKNQKDELAIILEAAPDINHSDYIKALENYQKIKKSLDKT